LKVGRKVQINATGNNLTINGANSCDGNVVVGGTHAFTLNINANQESFGTISVTEGLLTINVGAAVTNLSFANSAAVAWGTAGTVNITGYQYGKIRFGTTSTALTGAQLAKITVDGAGTGQPLALDRNGYLIIASSSTTTWTGGTNTGWNNSLNWSNGVPDQNTAVTIGTGTFQPSLFINISIKSLTINSGASLRINSDFNLTVKEAITNNGTLTINNNANLIQLDDVANTGAGSSIVNRDSNPLLRLDYTMWSSPVSGSQTLAQFSPLTSQAPNRFYTYNPVSNEYNATTFSAPFATGTGYLIRMPNEGTTNYNAGTETLVYPGQFTGTPNNGTITLSGLTSDKFYAVGNPYPSTLDAVEFIAANPSTLYFWRKTNGVANVPGASATGTSYATWTTLGSAASDVTPNDIVPNGTIQVGQGFIVKTGVAATSIVFTNDMRNGTVSTQFFKTRAAAEKSRVWLNLTNKAGVFSQALVGYVDGATLGVDNSIDGKYINDSAIALTSNINGEEYTIQGRPAFDATDVVALNFKTDVAGDFSIALGNFDGVFAAGQDVYLVDNKTGVETDLKAGNYTFTAAVGVDNTRFSLKYQKTLKVDAAAFNENSVSVYKNNGSLYVNTGSVAIDSIEVYDVQGRLLATQRNVKASTATISNLRAINQVLIVKISGENSSVVSKKVMN
jgi:trimeric autotransporter adhesin